jgi:hypothetical protein
MRWEIRYEWNPYRENFVYSVYLVEKKRWFFGLIPFEVSFRKDWFSTKEEAIEKLNVWKNRYTSKDTIGVVYATES